MTNIIDFVKPHHVKEAQKYIDAIEDKDFIITIIGPAKVLNPKSVYKVWGQHRSGVQLMLHCSPFQLEMCKVNPLIFMTDRVMAEINQYLDDRDGDRLKAVFEKDLSRKP